MIANILFASTAYAAPSQTGGLGVDISAPQCGERILNRFSFAVIGVNSGLATEPNPCLSDQLAWAKTVSGPTNQPRLQLYVNTANPGGLNTESWPQDNIDPSNRFVLSEYGLCAGEDSPACAWQYGWNRAYEDVNKWFPGAADKAGVDTNPAAYRWWLDVEIENTWKMTKQPGDFKSNIAVLEGMNAYFASQDIQTGLYSTAYQWNEITGSDIGQSSNLNSMPNWRPGGKSLQTAKQACNATPLTKNGSVVMTQYIYRGLDYNYSC